LEESRYKKTGIAPGWIRGLIPGLIPGLNLWLSA
jgi:hypothetical protein